MPGPGGIIDEFGDETDPYNDANEFVTQMRRKIAQEQKKLAPSERDRFEASFDVDGEISGDEDQMLLIETYDLLKQEDRYRFESFAQRDSVRPVNSSFKWTEDNESLAYFVMYHVPPGLYEEKRQEYLQPQPEKETAGPMERFGRKIDNFGRWIKSWFT